MSKKRTVKKNTGKKSAGKAQPGKKSKYIVPIITVSAVFAAVVTAALVFMLFSPFKADTPAVPSGDTENAGTGGGNGEDGESMERQTLEDKMKNKINATITMEDGGVITLELYPDVAPQSVRNFVSLARSGYYDGLKFHRIISGFMIQGGCPEGTGMGNPGYSIKGEFSSNGFANDLKHTRGVISMARSNNPDSAGSQFFIVHEDAEHLDGSYAAFGMVVSGMSVVDEIAKTPAGSNGAVVPENMPVIKSITIDDDIELPAPDKIGG